MNLKSFGRCGCGKYDILNCFWYNQINTAPWYLCNECFESFEKAMEDYKDFPIENEWEY